MLMLPNDKEKVITELMEMAAGKGCHRAEPQDLIVLEIIFRATQAGLRKGIAIGFFCGCLLSTLITIIFLLTNG